MERHSSWYLCEMHKYNKLRVDTFNKAQEYHAYIIQLNGLLNGLSSISSDFRSSEKHFLNGGFVVDGIAFDNGVLQKCAKKVDSCGDRLSSVISKTTSRENELNKEYEEYQKLYEEMEEGYKRQKAEEEAAAAAAAKKK